MRITADELREFLENLFRAQGVAEAACLSVARNMVWSELVGRSNYGLERVPIHIERLKRGVLEPHGRMTIRELGASLVHVDGLGGFGQHVAETAMAEAIVRARKTGVGVAGVSGSNSFGAGGYYLAQAADAGMIALVAGNSFPKVTPHGGRKPVLGTNPFSFGVPRRNGEHLLVDMATSAMSGSMVTRAVARGEPLPAGVAIDAEGQPITDHTRLAGGALLPFGGAKGFGLSLMVELLAGVLTGAGVTSGVASIFNDFTRNGDNGHFMLALDIGRWIDRDLFAARAEALFVEVKAAGANVQLPGETRWTEFARNSRHGITIDPKRWLEISGIAEAAGVKLPRVLD